MLKDFTINLLVGLSYKAEKIFYGYFGILSLANVTLIFTFYRF